MTVQQSKTVKQLADAVNMSSEVLLQKIKVANIKGVTSEEHLLTGAQTKQLLTHLRRKTITLKAKKDPLSLGGRLGGRRLPDIPTVVRAKAPQKVVKAREEKGKQETEVKDEAKAADSPPPIALRNVGIQMSNLRQRSREANKPAAGVSVKTIQTKDAKDTKEGGSAPPKTLQILTSPKKSGQQPGKRKRMKGKARRVVKEEKIAIHAFSKPTAPVVREVSIPEMIKVGDLAKHLAVKASEVIKLLMQMGEMVNVNQGIDQETAVLVVEEMGHKAILVREDALEASLDADVEAHDYPLLARPPVVTVMGHVDHGKTTLLDYIRSSKVASSEAGGITQGIGAYHVETKRGVITFIDTPGHAAFTAMRARGAKCTDIVVLVVAADDGVMPQTIEAIQHAKAAGAEIIVAINKADRPNADAERVQSDLAQHDVLHEKWGGQVMMQLVSAKTGAGVDDLLEHILLQAEMMELRAPVEGVVQGVVIEAKRDKKQGVVATILIQKGTLHKGDVMVVGRQFGRVRTLLNDRRKKVQSVTPSLPVAVFGLSDVPDAGDGLLVVSGEKRAREIAIFRQRKHREKQLATRRRPQLVDFKSQANRKEGTVCTTLNVILKADVQGSLEAIAGALNDLQSDRIKINLTGRGIGAITESDVQLALASQAIILAFQVRADAVGRRLIEKEGVDVHYFSVIYELIDTVKSTLTGLVGPQYRDEIIGTAKVREVFRSSKLGAIAGCVVEEGVVRIQNSIRVLRDQVVIYQGKLESLRRFKEEVTSVKFGDECGIGVKDYNDVRVDDRIEVYERVEVKPDLFKKE